MDARVRGSASVDSDGDSLLSELREFVIPRAELRRDRPIGAGAYGAVFEIAVPGAVCAAKILHGSLVPTQKYVRDRFVAECKLMSTLRHPRIVQFIGLCPLPGSLFPALVMERLHCNLDDTLTDNPLSKRVFPLSLKRSILLGVAGGLVFLHSYNIVHRDLSAKNILLNSAMEAKIADFGVARIADKTNMTPGPGAILYMPPEALGRSDYSTPVDIFSFGHLMLYVVTQTFPCDLLPASYTALGRGIKMRSEVDRRRKYIDSLRELLGKDHRIGNITCACLANDPSSRPDMKDVSKDLQAVVITDEPRNTKLEMIQMIERKEKEVNILKRQLSSKASFERISQMSWSRAKDMPFGVKRAFSVVLDGKVYIGGGDTTTEEQEQIVLVYNPDSDEWTHLPPCAVTKYAMACYQSELVLVGGRAVRPSEVPGRIKASVPSDKLWVWSRHSREWFTPYPALPKDQMRWFSSAVGHKNFLIVVGGRNYEEVNTRLPTTLVFDGTFQQWHQTSPLPSPSKRMPLAILSDTLYTFNGGQSGNHAYSISLSCLCGSARDARQGTDSASQVEWKKLSSHTAHFVAAGVFMNEIMVAGGQPSSSQETNCIFYYNNGTEKWEGFRTIFGSDFHLPFCRSFSVFTSLPDEQVLVAGGSEQRKQEHCMDVYIGRLS